jgi:hypothetical protein
VGEQGSSYRNALREKLDAIDPDARRAAAAILITTDPKGEPKALRIAIQGMDDWRSNDWREWYDLCLVLSFGSGTLTALEADLSRLGTRGKQFALRVLFRNGIRISEQDKRELLAALLSAYYLAPSEMELIKSEREQLVASLSSPEDRIARRAAEVLVQAGGLDRDLEARCWIVLSEESIFSATFEPALKRLTEDTLYAQTIDSIGEGFLPNGRRPLLPMLSRAITSNGSWKDVLWRFFMGKAGISTHDTEAYGLWALTYGRANPTVGAKIGLAAKDLLEDSMLTNHHSGEPIQWIALLADEFSSIAPSYLEKALLTGSTIEKQAACALIARLCTVPAVFVQRNRDFQIPRFPIKWEFRSRPVLLNTLRDYGRPSDQIPEETCDAMSELLYFEAPSESELEQISIEGPNGALIASVARFCFQIDANLDSLVSTMGRELNFWEQRSNCARTLVDIWRAVVAQVTEKGTATRGQFITELQRHLADRRHMVNAASELLGLGEPLPHAVLPALFEDLIENHAYRDYWLLRRLAAWLLSPSFSEENRAALSKGLSGAIDLLNLKSWNSTDLGNGDPRMFLAIPLCYAVLTGEFSPASREVFYRGMKFAAVQEPRQDRRDLSEIFEHIEPLIAAIPGGLIKDLLSNGLIHSDAVVRAVAKMTLSASAAAS